jgi:hypothetical protein
MDRPEALRMIPADQARFSAISTTLRQGQQIVIRPLSADDGESLAAFYAAVPRKDIRHYSPYPLTREQALKNAGAALSPREVVLVVVLGDGGIGGYAWYRWKQGADEIGRAHV